MAKGNNTLYDLNNDSEGIETITISTDEIDTDYTKYEESNTPFNLKKGTQRDDGYEGGIRRDSRKSGQWISRLELLEGIKVVTREAFSYCMRLEEVVFPDSIERIDDYAFFGCSNLKRIVVPNKKIKIGKNAFWGCGPSYVEINKGSYSKSNIPSYVRNIKEREKKEIFLACDICGHIHDYPLRKERAKKKELISYRFYERSETHAKDFNVGEEVEMTVHSPFCYKTGEEFYIDVDEKVINLKFLKVISYNVFKATIRVKVLGVDDYTMLVKKVSDEEKERLSSKLYKCIVPGGDSLVPYMTSINEHLFTVDNTYGGGDINSTYYIHTDEDGIDHQIASNYNDFDYDYTTISDKLLGFHKDSPYVVRNGKLICKSTYVAMDSAGEYNDYWYTGDYEEDGLEAELIISNDRKAMWMENCNYRQDVKFVNPISEDTKIYELCSPDNVGKLVLFPETVQLSTGKESIAIVWWSKEPGEYSPNSLNYSMLKRAIINRFIFRCDGKQVTYEEQPNEVWYADRDQDHDYDFDLELVMDEENRMMILTAIPKAYEKDSDIVIACGKEMKFSVVHAQNLMISVTYLG